MIGDNDSFSVVFITVFHRFGNKNGMALSRKAVRAAHKKEIALQKVGRSKKAKAALWQESGRSMACYDKG
jgi:hypothetical protein